MEREKSPEVTSVGMAIAYIMDVRKSFSFIMEKTGLSSKQLSELIECLKDLEKSKKIDILFQKMQRDNKN